MFLMKISLHNLRSNKTMTLPYLIASSIFTSFLFILLNLYLDTSIRTMHNSSTLKNILMLGVMSATVVKCWKIPIRKCRFSNIFLR